MKRRQTNRRNANAINVRRNEFEKVTDALKTVNVTRDEFIRVTDQICEHMATLEIQFQRIAQMQADIDFIKSRLAKLTK